MAISTLLVAGPLTVAPSTAADAPPAESPAAVQLGAAATYSVLAGASVANTGNATVISGDMGINDGAITGFERGEGVVQGIVHDGDESAAQARTDADAAYADAAGRTGATEFTGDQVGTTFAPGVYHSKNGFANTGTVTLDAGGDPTAVFIFQLGAALTPGANSEVVLAGGALATNVFWQVDAAVSIGANASYVGTFMSSSAITLGANTLVRGRALASAAVTLASNVITEPDSIAPDPLTTKPLNLGTATLFSVLGGTGVSNTGTDTVIPQNVGLSTSGALAGLVPEQVLGTIHDKDDAAALAETDRQAAYDDAASRTTTSIFSGDQDGVTFGPGVHRSSIAFANTDTMTLDAGGKSDSVFIFQVNAGFRPDADSKVELTGGARAANVFWQVLGNVTLGARSSYVGTFLSQGNTTLGDASALQGRILTFGGATLANSAIVEPEPDVVAPLVTIDGGPVASTTDTTPTISGTTDELVGTVVSVSVSDQALTTTAGADGTWAVTSAALPLGAHPVVAQVTDVSKNTGSAEQALTVITGPDPIPVQPDVVVPAPTYQPDIAIRRADRPFVGVGQYGDLPGQQVKQYIKGPTKMAKFVVKLTNGGTGPDRMKVRGTVKNAAFKVDYLVNGKSVNRAIRAGTYLTKELAPGATARLIIKVTPTRSVTPGDRSIIRIRQVSSHAPTMRDSARAQVRTVTAPQRGHATSRSRTGAWGWAWNG